MKKIICIFIVLICIPALSHAEKDLDIRGTWVKESKVDMNTWRIQTLQLLENGIALFSDQTFTYDGEFTNLQQKYSYKYDGSSVLVSDESETIMTLYVINKCRLSSDKRGTYGFYDRVPNTESMYDESKAASVPEINLNSCGKWSYYVGSTNLNNVIVMGDTRAISFELYFYEDGTVYISSGYLKKGSTKLNFEQASGIWIGDYKDMTFRIGDNSYKAFISDDEILHVTFPSGNKYSFCRVEDNEN